MHLNSLQWKVLQPFVDQTLIAMDKSLGLKGDADSGFQEKIEEFRFKGFAVVANTSGSVTGRLLMHHYTETAVTIGNKLLQKQNPNLSHDHGMDDSVSNALADFAQMIMQPAVESLQNNDLKIDFAQPYFISDTEKMDGLLEGVSEILTVPIRVDQIGRFYLNYLIHKQD